MATAKYHRHQAKTLLQLAGTSTDVFTAAALRELAAEHLKLADVAEKENGAPRPDQE
jgi:hypothetical protein